MHAEDRLYTRKVRYETVSTACSPHVRRRTDRKVVFMSVYVIANP